MAMLVVISPPILKKHMLVKLDHFPKNRRENQNMFESPHCNVDRWIFFPG